MYLKLLNENGSSRRERLRDNKIAEDLSVRSSKFISSRLESRLYPGKTIHQLVVSDLPNVFYPKQLNSSLPSSFRDLMSEERLLEEDGSPSPIRIPVEELSEKTLWKIRRLYSSLLMMTEDACNAAAYLYTCQPLFPTYFNPECPFSPIEWLLISGNIVLRTFPFSRPKEEMEVEKVEMEVKKVEMEAEKVEMEAEKVEMEVEKVESKPIEIETKPEPEPETKPEPKSEPETQTESNNTNTNTNTINNESNPLTPLETPSSKPLTADSSREWSDGWNGMEKEENSTEQMEVTPLVGVEGHAVDDRRACDLCGEVGDNLVCGRMLCTLTGEWVHLNCVYYSSGITIDEKESSIQKYTVVKNRSRSAQCYVCKRSGASIKCGASGCSRCFHFACGREGGCLIRVNKEAFCQYHRPSSFPAGGLVDRSFNPFSPRGVSSPAGGGVPRGVGASEAQVAVSASELFTTRFNHRVVFRSGARQSRSRSVERGLIRMGSVTVSHVGAVGISPRMHTERFLLPDQYRVFRVFWSAKRPGTRTLYCLEIHAEAEGEDPLRRPVFSISDMQSEIRFCSHDIQGRIAGMVRNRRVRGAARRAEAKRPLRNTATARARGTEKQKWVGRRVRCDGRGIGEIGENGEIGVQGSGRVARLGTGRVLVLRPEHPAGGGGAGGPGSEPVPRVPARGLPVVPVPPGAAARGAGDPRAGRARRTAGRE